MPFSPNAFRNSPGIPSTPTAFFRFISFTASIISLVNSSGPLQSTATLVSTSTSTSLASGFPSLSYSLSMYSFHLSLTLSGSVMSFPSPAFIVRLLPTEPLFLVNSLTFAYTKSDLPLLSSSSISSHSLSHYSDLALSVSLLSSLFSCLYLACPSAICLLFSFLLSLIFCSMAPVTHGFFAAFLVLYPTCTIAFLNMLSFSADHLSSTVWPSLGCISFSMPPQNISSFSLKLFVSHFL